MRSKRPKIRLTIETSRHLWRIVEHDERDWPFEIQKRPIGKKRWILDLGQAETLSGAAYGLLHLIGAKPGRGRA